MYVLYHRGCSTCANLTIEPLIIGKLDTDGFKISRQKDQFRITTRALILVNESYREISIS